MRAALKIFGFIFVVLTLADIVRAKDWHGITPLHSTRADVEGLLGQPQPPPKDGTRYYTLNKNRSIYFNDEGEIYIIYAEAEVQAAVDCLKMIPAGTVLMIEVRPKNELKLSDLSFDLKEFKKFDPSLPAGIGYEGYVDEQQGIVIRAFKGKVQEIVYIAAAQDKMLCPTFYENPKDFVRIMICGLSLSDSYGDLSFEDEKARLDQLAIQLQNDSEAKGYIIVYGGRRSRIDEAKTRTERAKNYLLFERAVQVGRIETIDGGYREKLTVELFILPKDVAAPTAVPTVDPKDVEIITDLEKSRKKKRRIY